MDAATVDDGDAEVRYCGDAAVDDDKTRHHHHHHQLQDVGSETDTLLTRVLLMPLTMRMTRMMTIIVLVMSVQD